MLKGVTWGEFWTFMLVVIGLYYLYVGLRYYREELLGWVTRRSGRELGSRVTEDAGKGRGLADEAARKAAADQGELFRGELAGDGDNEQAQQMNRAIEVIRQVVAQGVENKLDRENLLDHVREVLGNYRLLRKTEYATTINNFIIWICKTELSLELDEQQLAALWK